MFRKRETLEWLNNVRQHKEYLIKSSEDKDYHNYIRKELDLVIELINYLEQE